MHLQSNIEGVEAGASRERLSQKSRWTVPKKRPPRLNSSTHTHIHSHTCMCQGARPTPSHKTSLSRWPPGFCLMNSKNETHGPQEGWQEHKRRTHSASTTGDHPAISLGLFKRLMTGTGVRQAENGKLVGLFDPTMGCWVSLLSSNSVLMYSKQRCSFRRSVRGNQDSSWHPWPLARAELKAFCLNTFGISGLCWGQNHQQGQRHFWLSAKKTMFYP